MKRLVLLWILCLFPGAVQADDMGLALSRLRVPAGDPACSRSEGLCADQEAFERLVSELAIAAAPVITEAAHTEGIQGFSISLIHSITTIDPDQVYWQRGTEGADSQAGVNAQPATALTWTRLQLRKGLPLGVELGADVGHAWDTPMWSVAGRLKVALVEGFSTGVGRLPDVAIEAVTQAVVGESDLSLWTHALGLVLSKPLLVADRLRVSPLFGAQMVLVSASSGAVDLAADACLAGTPCDLTLSNVVRFAPVQQLRLRFSLGAQLQVSHVRLVATGMVEAPRETMEAAGRSYGGDLQTLQWTLNLGAGADF